MMKRYGRAAMLFSLVFSLVLSPHDRIVSTVHVAESAPTAVGWLRLLTSSPTKTDYYNVRYTTAVAAASDGGFAVLGTHQGWPWLGKFDVNGQPQWSYAFDDPTPFSDIETPAALEAFPSGGFLVVIKASSTRWLIKISNQGGVVWKRALTGFSYSPFALAIRADGKIAIVNSDIHVAVMDGNTGAVQWAKNFSPYYNQTAAPAFTQDGGLILGLARYDNGHLIKFAADGTIQWQKASLGGLSKIVPLDNGQFVAATAYGTLFQFDAAGNTVWERRYTETQVTIRPARADYFAPGFNSLIRLTDGSLVAAGITTNDTADTPQTESPESDIWIVKTDGTGNLIWSRRYGRVGRAILDGTSGMLSAPSSSQPPYVSTYNSLVALADGLLVVGNHYEITTLDPNFGLMLKLNSEGLVGGTCAWQLPSVATTSTLQVRYPTFEQIAEPFTTTLSPVEVSMLSSPVQVTTACDATSSGAAVIANAGPDFTASNSITVTFDGSKSVDSSGAGLSYRWRQIAGPWVALDSTNTVSPTFVTPNFSTTLIFEMVVTSLTGGATSKDEVVITVKPGVAPTQEPTVRVTFTATPIATLAGTSTATSEATFTPNPTQGPTVSVTTTPTTASTPQVTLTATPTTVSTPNATATLTPATELGATVAPGLTSEPKIRGIYLPIVLH